MPEAKQLRIPRKARVYMPKKRQNGTAMSAEHKAKLSEGREHGRVVRRYLEALEANKPRRGRRRTSESIQKRLDAISSDLASSDPLTRLHLLQERRNLQTELDGMDETIDLTALEKDFVGVARTYAERKGITYDVWREAGVDPGVLKDAGISRRGQ